MSKVRVFVSFDVDHDNDCRVRLVDQIAPEGSRFSVDDWSIRELAKDWQDKARKRISNVDLLLVICGEHTDTAVSVNNEIAFARELNKPYFLLDGRPGRSRTPKAAHESDRMLDWSQDTVGSPLSPGRAAVS